MWRQWLKGRKGTEHSSPMGPTLSLLESFISPQDSKAHPKWFLWERDISFPGVEAVTGNYLRAALEQWNASFELTPTLAGSFYLV